MNKQKLGFTDKELEEFRTIILKKLDKAKNQLNYCKAIIEDQTENEPINANALDEQTGTMNMEHFHRISRTTKNYIEHLKKALERIDNKVYGICRKTGKLISKERLKAVPHATLSIEAKQGKN